VFRTFIRTRVNPTVTLTSTSYKHETYGRIYKPKFLIVKAPQVARGGTLITSGKPTRGGAPADFDDDVPF
jgi:hypothetical protein